MGSTSPASFRWTADHTFLRTCASGWEIREDTGKATRSWSRRQISVGNEFSLIPHGGGGSGTYRGASSALNLTERFTRVSDEFIDYQFTVDDPNLYTSTWAGAVPLTTIESPGGVLEYACHEGNYAIVTSLGGALGRDAALESK